MQVATFRILTYDGPKKRIPVTALRWKKTSRIVWHADDLWVRDGSHLTHIDFRKDGVLAYAVSLYKCKYVLEWVLIKNDMIEFMIKAAAVTSYIDQQKFPPQWWAQARLMQSAFLPLPDDLKRVVFGFM